MSSPPSFRPASFPKNLYLERTLWTKKSGAWNLWRWLGEGFPIIGIISFESMPDLEEWSGLEGDITHVGEIYIDNCSKLRGLPPFLQLKTPCIRKCEKLVTLPRFSTIPDLFSSLQYLTSLSNLEISEFPNLTSLPNGLQCLKSIWSLTIDCCPQLKSLGDEVLPHHSSKAQNFRLQ